MSLSQGLSTLMLHADEAAGPDVAVPLHVSTTYRYDKGYNDRVAVARGWLKPEEAANPDDTTPHIYSRDTTEVRSRLETVLGKLESAHAVTYSSGLSAAYAVFLHFQPKRIYMSYEGYHGVHGVLDLYSRGRNVTVIYREKDTDGSGLQSLEAGDLIWLESPQNPRGEVADLAHYISKRAKGVIIGVDSTFAPPPIQNLLTHGADVVMHSSTKFLGGHSDLLGGVVMTRDLAVHEALSKDRMYTGAVMGNMEAWLLLRSMRTFKVRVMQQSETATKLAKWLNSRIAGESDEEALAIVERVWHASLPDNPGHEAAKRQGAGFSGVLSIDFVSHHHARLVCSNLKYFINATSLGGCESLIEWRAVSDSKISPKLCRVSVGLEEFEDLQADMRQAFAKVAKQVAELHKA